MQLTVALPPAAAKCEQLDIEIDESTSICDVKVKVADAIDIPCHRPLQVYFGTRLLSNRCMAKDFVHLSVVLPSTEVSVTFVDRSTDLKMVIRMGNNCPFLAALTNWFHPFDEPTQLYVRNTWCNLMTTPGDIQWGRTADKIVTIVSNRGHLL